MSWAEYNANTWTSDDLIADVRRRARISANDLNYTDAVILREASDQIWSIPARIEAEARDGRKTFDASRSVSTDAVSTNGADYMLPPMCAADAISSILWVNADGSMRKLAATSIDREADYLSGGATGEPTAYAMLDRTLRLYPTPTGVSGTLRVIYQRRHPALVQETGTMEVAAVSSASSGNATQFTVSSVLSDIDVGAWIDVVGYRVPHSVRYADARVTAVDPTHITVGVPYATMTAAIEATASHNYVQPSGQSYFVQLPLEMRSAVTALTAAVILKQIGDSAGAASAESGAMRELADITNFLAGRSKGTKQKILNRFSFMRSHNRGWF